MSASTLQAEAPIDCRTHPVFLRLLSQPGHSAVAACAAVMAMTAVPARWRPVLAAVAGLVGLARIVHGVHLPADLVGGWSFGTLVALCALAVLDRIEPTHRNQIKD